MVASTSAVDHSLSGRRTRSGALFSPWEIDLSTAYEIPIDLSDFLGEAIASAQYDEDDDLGIDAPEEAENDAFLEPLLPPKRAVESSPFSAESGSMAEACASLPKGKAASKNSQKRRDRQRENRRKGRTEKQRLLGAKTKGVARKRMEQARIQQLSSDVRDSRHTSTGVFGLRPTVSCANKQVLALEKDGFKLVPWDDPSQSFALIDCQGRLFVGGGSPRDIRGWDDVNVEACEAINNARESCSFTSEQREHQRGSFPVLASGISYGNGRTHPMNVKNTARNTAALKKLFEKDALKRIVGLQNQLFHSFSPSLGAFYAATLHELLEFHPHLKRNFPNSDFACITVNFGPVTETIDHVDRANLATGLCAVTALGDFDPKKGGHLVLWDLKLILEFPPGATILLPSALLRHSNTPLGEPGCQRFSVTQYSPGGLFRWVENGFCSNLECAPELNSDAEGKRRWEEGLKRFSTVPCSSRGGVSL